MLVPRATKSATLAARSARCSVVAPAVVPSPAAPLMTSSQEMRAEPPGYRRNKRGARNRQHPREHDIAGDAPAYRRNRLRRADPDDCAGDRMRGRNRDTQAGGEKQHDSAAGFGAAAANRPQLGDLLSHGLDDPPAPESRTQ